MSSPVTTEVSSLGPVLSVLLLNNEYTNDTTNGIKQDDLANFMGSLGSQTVIAAYLKRIDDAISNTTFADVDSGANAATAGGMGVSTVTTLPIAQTTFKVYMTWHVIKKAFNSGHTALSAANGSPNAVLTVQEQELNKRMLYVVQKGYGNSWFNAIAARVFPKFNFKVAYAAATGGASGYVVSEVLSTATGYEAASFFEISPNSMTSFSAMAPVIRQNNGSNVLSVSDLPPSGVFVKGAMSLALGKSDTESHAGVTAAELKTVLPLVNATSSNLLNDLLSSTSSGNDASGNSTKLPKTIIGQMTDPRLLDSFAKMTGNELLAYVPASVTKVRRSQYDSSAVTKIFEYSVAVSRVDALVKLGGWSYEKLLGIYLANPGLTTDSDVRTHLKGTTTADRTASAFTGLSANAGDNVVLTDVFAAYRHYLQPAKFAYASLQTSAQIADWISESGISALLTATPANTAASSGVNAGANKYSDILGVLATGSDKPSGSLDVHFDAIKILAQQVSGTSSNASFGKSVAEIVNAWFTTPPSTTDTPSGASETGFWNLPVATSIEYAELKFALYVLSTSFTMLSDSSNDKWFAKLVKVGAVVTNDSQTNGAKNLYGLNGTTTVAATTGKPVSNFGSDDQILRAVNGISANESSFTKVKFYLTVKGAVTSFAGIETLYNVFGVSDIVNLPSIPQQKDATTPLITSATDKMAKALPDGTTRYPGFTSNTDAHKNLLKRMTFVSKVHDLITAANLANSNAINAAVASNNHLKLFSATDSGDFFKYQVPYANISVDATANVAFKNIINIIMGQDSLKINPFITANSRATDWSVAILHHMNNNPAFTKDILDATDTTSPDVLRPSGSVTLRSIATSVETLLNKPLYINPDNQAAETRVTLSSLISGTATSFSGKQGNIIFSWYGSISDGGSDNTKMTEASFNNLIAIGIPRSDIINSVYSRPAVVGFQVGGISFSTFVGTDANGNPIFDSV